MIPSVLKVHSGRSQLFAFMSIELNIEADIASSMDYSNSLPVRSQKNVIPIHFFKRINHEWHLGALLLWWYLVTF